MQLNLKRKSKRKSNRKKKILRVLKRKWTKPALYTLVISALLYTIISNSVIQRNYPSADTPHFVITRLSDKFDDIEFMHLLLTIQELNKNTKSRMQLIGYANSNFSSPCPKYLKNRLDQMNWTPQAFWVRIQKTFKMHETYQRVTRMDETINFLSSELAAHRLPSETATQIELLKNERQALLDQELPPEEYEFIKTYDGLIIGLIKNNP